MCLAYELGMMDDAVKDLLLLRRPRLSIVAVI